MLLLLEWQWEVHTSQEFEGLIKHEVEQLVVALEHAGD